MEQFFNSNTVHGNKGLLKYKQDVERAETVKSTWQRIIYQLERLVESLPSFPTDQAGALKRLNNYHKYLEKTELLIKRSRLVGARKVIVPCINEVISFKEALQQEEILPEHCDILTFDTALSLAKKQYKKSVNRHASVQGMKDIKEIAQEASYTEAERILQQTVTKASDVTLIPGTDHGMSRAPIVANIRGFSIASAKNLKLPMESLAGYAMFNDQVVIGVHRDVVKGTPLTPLEYVEKQLKGYAEAMRVRKLSFVSEKPTFKDGTYWYWCAIPNLILTLMEATKEKDLQVLTWGFAF